MTDKLRENLGKALECELRELLRTKEAPYMDLAEACQSAARAALAAMDTPKGCGDGWQPIETCVSGDGPVLIYNPDMESDPEWPSHAVHVSNRDYVTSGNAKKEGFTAWHPVPPAPPAAMKDGG